MLGIALGVILGFVTLIVTGVLLSYLIAFIEAVVARYDAMVARAARRSRQDDLWTESTEDGFYSPGASPIRSR